MASELPHYSTGQIGLLGSKCAKSPASVSEVVLTSRSRSLETRLWSDSTMRRTMARGQARFSLDDSFHFVPHGAVGDQHRPRFAVLADSLRLLMYYACRFTTFPDSLRSYGVSDIRGL